MNVHELYIYLHLRNLYSMPLLLTKNQGHEQKIDSIANYLCVLICMYTLLYNQNMKRESSLYRTSGVIFFIDYCTAIRDT
jgi:hypothetical protein